MDERIAKMSFTAEDLAEQREFDLRVMFDGRQFIERIFQQVDALFIHSRDDLDIPMLREAAMLFIFRKAKKVVINGLSRKQCLERNLAYPGYEEWRRQLKDMGVDFDDIRPVAF